MSRTPWQDFARDIARLAAPPDAEYAAARHLTVKDLPDLLSTLDGAISAAYDRADEWRDLLCRRAVEVYADPRLSVERSRGEHPGGKRWRVFSQGCPVGYGQTEGEAILAAIEARAEARELGAAVEWLRRTNDPVALRLAGQLERGAHRTEAQPEEPAPAVTR